MHATKERKKHDSEGFTITTKVATSRIPIECIQQMAARSNRIGDKRRKIKAKDERKMAD